uniref:Immunoglobulin V-set domain-containing protein n=1 Tax=Neolamprologus brichardi TaxID=32507 RepID=A0A3Q4G8S5_NEOBR
QWSVLLCCYLPQCFTSLHLNTKTYRTHLVFSISLYYSSQPLTPGVSHYNQCLTDIRYYNRKETLQLLGFLFLGKGTIEPGVNVTMDGGANVKENCTLTIKDIELSSSGVYFCAASYHSASHHCTSIQKPIKHICHILLLKTMTQPSYMYHVHLTDLSL